MSTPDNSMGEVKLTYFDDEGQMREEIVTEATLNELIPLFKENNTPYIKEDLSKGYVRIPCQSF